MLTFAVVTDVVDGVRARANASWMQFISPSSPPSLPLFIRFFRHSFVLRIEVAFFVFSLNFIFIQRVIAGVYTNYLIKICTPARLESQCASARIPNVFSVSFSTMETSSKRIRWKGEATMRCAFHFVSTYFGHGQLDFLSILILIFHRILD